MKTLSCQEVYERMDNGLCLFCEELDSPDHYHLKHKRVQIFMTVGEDDQLSDDNKLNPVDLKQAEYQVKTIPDEKLNPPLGQNIEHLEGKPAQTVSAKPTSHDLNPHVRFHGSSPASPIILKMPSVSPQPPDPPDGNRSNTIYAIKAEPGSESDKENDDPNHDYGDGFMQETMLFEEDVVNMQFGTEEESVVGEKLLLEAYDGLATQVTDYVSGKVTVVTDDDIVFFEDNTKLYDHVYSALMSNLRKKLIINDAVFYRDVEMPQELYAVTELKSTDQIFDTMSHIKDLLRTIKRKQEWSKSRRFKFKSKLKAHKLTVITILLWNNGVVIPVTSSKIIFLPLDEDNQMLQDGKTENDKVLLENSGSVDSHYKACLLKELACIEFVGGKTHGDETLVAGWKVMTDLDFCLESHRKVHMRDILGSKKKQRCGKFWHFKYKHQDKEKVDTNHLILLLEQREITEDGRVNMKLRSPVCSDALRLADDELMGWRSWKFKHEALYGEFEDDVENPINASLICLLKGKNIDFVFQEGSFKRELYISAYSDDIVLGSKLTTSYNRVGEMINSLKVQEQTWFKDQKLGSETLLKTWIGKQLSEIFQAIQVWEPGGFLLVQVQQNLFQHFHNDGLKYTQVLWVLLKKGESDVSEAVEFSMMVNEKFGLKVFSDFDQEAWNGLEIFGWENKKHMPLINQSSEVLNWKHGMEGIIELSYSQKIGLQSKIIGHCQMIVVQDYFVFYSGSHMHSMIVYGTTCALLVIGKTSIWCSLLNIGMFLRPRLLHDKGKSGKRQQSCVASILKAFPHAIFTESCRIQTSRQIAEHETSRAASRIYHRWKNKAGKWLVVYVLIIWDLAFSQSSKEHGFLGLVLLGLGLNEDAHKFPYTIQGYGELTKLEAVGFRNTSLFGSLPRPTSFRTLEKSLKGLSKHKDPELSFPKNHNLLHSGAGFWTDYNDVEQLSTELQNSPGLNYSTHLIFLWNQALNCGCEVDHMSSGIFFVDGVHEFDTCSKLQICYLTQGKRLLFLTEVSPLFDDANEAQLVVKENWFHNNPTTIEEVFHLLRPPELLKLHGYSDFFTKYSKLSSLRTRMLSTREYCDRNTLVYPIYSGLWYGLSQITGLVISFYNSGRFV